MPPLMRTPTEPTTTAKILSTLTGGVHPRGIVVIHDEDCDHRRLSETITTDEGTMHLDLGEYAYEDLGEAQFRLIKLSQNPTGRLTIELEKFSLTSHPPYDALSYAWQAESELRKASVICNDSKFMLSPDLEMALHRVWLAKNLTDPANEPDYGPYLWNDFISINQRNFKEREAQVRHMADIFAKAQRTIVWLGLADQPANAMLLSIPDLVHALSNLKSVVSNAQLSDVGLLDHEIWESLSHFFHRPWFKRLWVLQEVVLAPQVVLICGEIVVEWKLLSRLVALISKLGLYRLASGHYDYLDLKTNGLGTVMAIERLREGNTMFENDRSANLRFILDAGWGKQCLEPVDHVWALVGLLTDLLRRDIFDQNIVDYSEHGRTHYFETFVRVAKWWIPVDISGILCMAARSQRSHEFPSWCPDWSALPRCSDFGRIFHSAGGSVLNSTAESQRSPRLAIYHHMLAVQGFRIDKIDSVSKSVWNFSPQNEKENAPHANYILEWEAEAMRIADAAVKHNNEERLTKECEVASETLKTYLRAVSGGEAFLDDSNCPYTASESNDIESIMVSDYKAWLKLIEAYAIGTETDEIEWTIVEPALRFQWVASQVCAGRRLVSTTNGRLGVASPDVQVGDLICIFYGARMPWIIRGRGDGTPWRFVGDAYVKGLMKAESLTFEVNPQGPAKADERAPDEIFLLE